MASTLPLESISSAQPWENLPQELIDWFENVKKIEGVAKTILQVVGRKSLESKTLLDDPFDLIQAAKDLNVLVSDLHSFQEEDYVELMEDIKKFIQGVLSTTIRVNTYAFNAQRVLHDESTWFYFYEPKINSTA